jgi:hypothetical protein
MRKARPQVIVSHLRKQINSCSDSGLRTTQPDGGSCLCGDDAVCDTSIDGGIDSEMAGDSVGENVIESSGGTPDTDADDSIGLGPDIDA